MSLENQLLRDSDVDCQRFWHEKACGQNDIVNVVRAYNSTEAVLNPKTVCDGIDLESMEAVNCTSPFDIGNSHIPPTVLLMQTVIHCCRL